MRSYSRAAAPSALAIVLVGIVPVVLLSRAISRSRPGSRMGAGQGMPAT